MADTLYEALVVVHILCAIVGFGAIVFNGVFVVQALRRPRSEGVAILEVSASVSLLADFVILMVLVTGLVLLFLNQDGFTFAQVWVSIALTAFLIILALTYGVMLPTGRRLIAMAAGSDESPKQATGTEAKMGRRYLVASVAVDVLMLVILVVMIYKPGYVSPE